MLLEINQWKEELDHGGEGRHHLGSKVLEQVKGKETGESGESELGSEIGIGKFFILKGGKTMNTGTEIYG